EAGAEVGQVVVIDDDFVEPSDLGQLDRFAKRHLGLRRCEPEAGVPGAAVRPVEAAAERMCVTEGSIDYPEVRHAEYQLIEPDPRQEQEIVLRLQTVIGRVV